MEVTRVATAAAVAVVTVLVLAVGGIRAQIAAPETPPVAAATTTTVAPTTVPVTSTTQPSRSTKATTTTVARPRQTTTTSRTTTTVNHARLAAKRVNARKVCLQLAAANNSQVIIANLTWYRQRLLAFVARGKLGGPRYRALQLEQAQAEVEIRAQYTIDKSNCYLK